MKRKKLMTKVLPAIMAASMVMSLAPTTAFAVTGSQVAKDGTYTATSHVVKTEEDSDDEWDEYDVEVAVSVKDGKFSDIVVTPKNGYTSENASYVNKAYTKSKGIKTLLVGKDATAENIETWSTVSSATRTSKAVKDAALEAISGAPEAKQETVSDVTTLITAIEKAEKVNTEGKDAWIGDWDHFQEHLTEAKEVLAAYEKDAVKGTTQEEVNQAVADLTDTMDNLMRYMLMDIPYADFYASDVTNSDKVDVVTSATLQKSRNGSLANGSYHSKTDGTEIAGVIYPVAISAADWSEIDWSQYKQVTDKDSVEITTSIKGKEQTATYTGKQALFEQNDYSYYLLSAAETPDNYKTIAVKDGNYPLVRLKEQKLQRLRMRQQH